MTAGTEVCDMTVSGCVFENRSVGFASGHDSLVPAHKLLFAFFLLQSVCYEQTLCHTVDCIFMIM